MEPIADFPKFVRLSYIYKNEIDAVLKKLESEISELSLGFLYGYKKNFCFEATKIFGNICIHGNIQDTPSFLPPIGNNKLVETIDVCLSFLDKHYGNGRINSVPKNMADLFSTNNKFKVISDRDNYDYLYKIEDLVDLSGSKYHSKKNLVVQFKNKYTYQYKELTADIVSACIELEEQWCNVKHCLMNELMSMENRCVYELLNNFAKLGLFGGAIFIDGQIQAFTIGEKVNPNAALVHVEKANTKYKGIYQAINNMFCEQGLSRFVFVNREQDDGDQGLRKAKLSYQPFSLIEKYNIELA